MWRCNRFSGTCHRQGEEEKEEKGSSRFFTKEECQANCFLPLDVLRKIQSYSSLREKSLASSKATYRSFRNVQETEDEKIRREIDRLPPSLAKTELLEHIEPWTDLTQLFSHSFEEDPESLPSLAYRVRWLFRKAQQPNLDFGEWFYQAVPKTLLDDPLIPWVQLVKRYFSDEIPSLFEEIARRGDVSLFQILFPLFDTFFTSTERWKGDIGTFDPEILALLAQTRQGKEWLSAHPTQLKTINQLDILRDIVHSSLEWIVLNRDLIPEEDRILILGPGQKLNLEQAQELKRSGWKIETGNTLFIPIDVAKYLLQTGDINVKNILERKASSSLSSYSDKERLFLTCLEALRIAEEDPLVKEHCPSLPLQFDEWKEIIEKPLLSILLRQSGLPVNK